LGQMTYFWPSVLSSGGPRPTAPFARHRPTRIPQLPRASSQRRGKRERNARRFCLRNKQVKARLRVASCSFLACPNYSAFREPV
jgi:hypothetical protein